MTQKVAFIHIEKSANRIAHSPLPTVCFHPVSLFRRQPALQERQGRHHHQGLHRQRWHPVQAHPSGRGARVPAPPQPGAARQQPAQQRRVRWWRHGNVSGAAQAERLQASQRDGSARCASRSRPCAEHQGEGEIGQARRVLLETGEFPVQPEERGGGEGQAEEEDCYERR